LFDERVDTGLRTLHQRTLAKAEYSVDSGTRSLDERWCRPTWAITEAGTP
jgi:hypothetical protein